MKRIKDKPVTAILYIRTASQEKGKINRSFLKQRMKLESYCKKEKITITEVISENVSGGVFNRKEFQKMLNKLKTGELKSDILLFTSWDRFSRNSSMTKNMVTELNGLGIDAKSIQGELNLDELQLKELNFQDNIQKRTDKLRKVIQSGKQQGKWLNFAPMGYKNIQVDKKNKLIIPDENSQKIKWLFEEFSTSKYTVDEITRNFNRSAPMLSRHKILQVLKNPIYMGKIPVEINDDKETALITGIHAPLISIELFNTVQEIINNPNSNNNLL
jgi:site-specific DNA recombinase